MNNDQFRTWPVLRSLGAATVGRRLLLTPDTLLTVVSSVWSNMPEGGQPVDLDVVWVTVALAPITEGDAGLPQMLSSQYSTSVRVWPDSTPWWHGAPTTIHG